MDDEIKQWITVKGNHIPIKEGQTVEEAIAERFDYEDEEVNLETDDLDKDVELVTTRYVLEGFGTINPLAYERLKGEGKNVYIETERTPIDNLPYAKLNKREDYKTAASKVNPLFKTGDYEWTYNCQRCVVAYEMRLRGYDVTAKPRLPKDEDTIFQIGSKWSESFEGFSWESPGYYSPGDNAYSAELLERDMIKQGEGARFVMCIQWRKHYWQDRADGHVLIGIVKDHKVVYYDPQSGKKAQSWKYKCNPRETMYARIDNLHIDAVKAFNCVYNKGEQPTRKSLTRGWITKEESGEGYESI